MRSKKLPQSDIRNAFGKLSTSEMRYSRIFGEWKAAGYPEDIGELTALLQRLGYTKRQINSALEQTTVADTGDEDIDQLIKRLHQYIVAHGLVDEIKTQMSNEFGFGSVSDNTSPSMFSRFKRLFKHLSEEEFHDVTPDDPCVANDDDELLSEEQYNRLLQELDRRLLNRLSAGRIKRKIVNAWKRGMHKRTHYDNMLRHMNLSVKKLV